MFEAEHTTKVCPTTEHPTSDLVTFRQIRSGPLPSSDGFSRRLFLERHGHRRIRREANRLPLDAGDQREVDEMRVALVLALAAVALREPDAPVGDTVDGADVGAVRANHFHVVG